MIFVHRNLDNRLSHRNSLEQFLFGFIDLLVFIGRESVKVRILSSPSTHRYLYFGVFRGSLASIDNFRSLSVDYLS